MNRHFLLTRLGGLFEEQKTQLVTQLPGTTVPDWYVTVEGLGVSSDTCYSCLDMILAPAGFGTSIGTFPYLVVTEQFVSDPSQVPNVPAGDPGRYEGSFNWPGIAYNQPGDGQVGGLCVAGFIGVKIRFYRNRVICLLRS
jgi:hypothetical protein